MMSCINSIKIFSGGQEYVRGYSSYYKNYTCLNWKSVKTEKKEISDKGKNTDDKTFNRKDRKVKQEK